MLTSELKFIVSEKAASELRSWARLELAADPHAAAAGGDGYRTTTLYFDTGEFDLYFRRGSYGRAKFRIRRYNDDAAVFLERKLKARDRVSKRRSGAAPADLRLISGTAGSWSGGWFARRLAFRRLVPVCQVGYFRTARIGELRTRRMRLTLDHNVTAAPIDSIGFTNTPGIDLLPGSVILELKYEFGLPPLFDEIMKAFDLKPQPVSKYRLAVGALGLAAETCVSHDGPVSVGRAIVQGVSLR